MPQCKDPDDDYKFSNEMANGHDATKYKCCNNNNCKPEYLKASFWCSGGYANPVGAAVVAADLVVSAVNKSKTECKKYWNAKSDCEENNCTTDQYPTDSTCSHCLPAARKRDDKPTNQCKAVRPVYTPNRFCSYHGYNGPSPTGTEAGSIHSAKGMASRWKDWCHKRQKDRFRKRTKYTYLGGTLGDIIKNDANKKCDRRGMTKKPTSFETGATGLYFQEADLEESTRGPPQPITYGRTVPDYVIAPEIQNRQKPADFDNESEIPKKLGGGNIKPYTYWESPCEFKCDYIHEHGRCRTSAGVNFVQNCNDKKCEIFVGPAYAGSDGWDWGGQYLENKGKMTKKPSYLKQYLDNKCTATSDFQTVPAELGGGTWYHLRGPDPKITPTGDTEDDWTSWGGVYPHTAPNLVGYGADGKWGSEDNHFSNKDKPYNYPQNSYFHTMSPLSIMGAKSFIDLKNNSQVGDNYFKDKDKFSNNTKTKNGDLTILTSDNQSNKDNYRPRHVQTYMTSCTGDINDNGSFPELKRNKLFFEKNQRSTALYPSELASQTKNEKVKWPSGAVGRTGNKRNTKAQIKMKGEHSSKAKGGILRGCMRKTNDYDSANILNCCIMGKPIDNKESIREGETYTCPSKYCRNVVLETGLPFNQRHPQKYAKCKEYRNQETITTSGGAGGTNACFVMSDHCRKAGAEICKKYHDDDTINTLCDAWANIQPNTAKNILKQKCTWFFGNKPDAVILKELFFKKGPIENFTNKEKKVIKRLYHTLNNSKCQEVIKKNIDNNTFLPKIKSFCKNTVEEAYGKCLPVDKSSPSSPKAKQSPSPQEIKKCKEQKNDPIECERSGDCIFEFKDKSGNEYKSTDSGVVKYYRKTPKGALLSSEIYPYDNNLKGKELIKAIKESEIHKYTHEEGIGADICGCFLGINNDYNKWYKQNKIFDIEKDDDIDNLLIGKTNKCWVSNCIDSNFVGEDALLRECPNVFACLQKQKIKINTMFSDGKSRPLSLLRKATKGEGIGSQSCHFKTKETIQDINLDNLDGADSKIAEIVKQQEENIKNTLTNMDNKISQITGTEDVKTKVKRAKKKKAESNTTVILIVSGVIVLVFLIFLLVM